MNPIRGWRAYLGAAVVVGGAVAAASLIDTRPSIAQELNLDLVFPCYAEDDAGKAQCAEGREIILNDCTICHTFVPIVMQQFEPDGWMGLIARHREGDRIGGLSDAEVETVTNYIIATYNRDHEPPELPPALLETWTAY